MNLANSPQNKAKEAAAKAAVDLVQNGIILGLGTGTTTEFFIKHLIERCHQGLNIRIVATSKHTLELAIAGGLKPINMDELKTIDLTIDGADEVDAQKRMIKGGGGALLREKIVASLSRKMVVIVDEKKVVKQLGKHPLPVEIVPFAHKAIQRKLESLGYYGKFRLQKNGELFVTDNSNYILDIHFEKFCAGPEETDKKIKSIPGVVETGLFLNLASSVIVGYEDGKVKILD